MQNLAKEGIRLRFLYWFAYLALGAGVPFFNLYYKHVLVSDNGTPAIEFIGMIAFIGSLLGLITNLIAGIAADKFKIENRLLFIASIVTMSGAIFISLPGFTAFFPQDLGHKLVFIGIGIILNSIFICPIVPLINTAALQYLHNAGRDPREIGKYRVLGTIAWVVSTAAIGLLLQVTLVPNIPPLLYACGFFILIFISLGGFKAKIKPVKIPWDYLKKDRQFVRFLFFAFLQGFGLLSSYNFTSYFMDDVHLGPLFIGIAFAVSAATEVPIMFFSKQIADRIGNRMMVIFGTGFLTLKFILMAIFAIIKNPYLTIAAMSLHGIGFGLQFNGMIQMVDGYAHKEMKATYVNLWTMFGSNLATALGGLFCAFIIKVLDSTWMLSINSAIVVLAIVFFVFLVKERTPSGQSDRG